MTPSPEAPAQTLLPPRGVRQAFARERALLALVDLGRRRGFALRAAQLAAFGLFLGYAVVLWLTRNELSQAEQRRLLHTALVSLSWVVGAVASFTIARNQVRSLDSAGITALARLRGFTARDVLRARVLSAALRVTRLIAVPGLLLVALTRARGAGPTGALVGAPALLLYASILGLCLALLAEIAAQVAPRYPRALIAALVLGPLLVAQAYPWVPSLPGAFATLLDHLVAVGGVRS